MNGFGDSPTGQLVILGVGEALGDDDGSRLGIWRQELIVEQRVDVRPEQQAGMGAAPLGLVFTRVFGEVEPVVVDDGAMYAGINPISNLLESLAVL